MARHENPITGNQLVFLGLIGLGATWWLVKKKADNKADNKAAAEAGGWKLLTGDTTCMRAGNQYKVVADYKAPEFVKQLKKVMEGYSGVKVIATEGDASFTIEYATGPDICDLIPKMGKIYERPIPQQAQSSVAGWL